MEFRVCSTEKPGLARALRVPELDDYEAGVHVRWYSGVDGGSSADEVRAAVRHVLDVTPGDMVILAEADELVLRRTAGRLETFPCDSFPSLAGFAG